MKKHTQRKEKEMNRIEREKRKRKEMLKQLKPHEHGVFRLSGARCQHFFYVNHAG